MWRPDRICGSYGNLVQCHDFNALTKPSTQYLQSLIQAHAHWINGYLGNGWDGYLFTVMFNNMPGKRKTKIIQMHCEIERLYGRLVTRMVRKPRSPKWMGLLPIGLFVPDSPVPKFRKDHKSSIPDVSINDGIHMHGIVLGHRWGRIRGGLDEHFAEKQEQYLTDKIPTIMSSPLRKPGLSVEYNAQEPSEAYCLLDEILVLNWGNQASDRIHFGVGVADFAGASELMRSSLKYGYRSSCVPYSHVHVKHFSFGRRKQHSRCRCL